MKCQSGLWAFLMHLQGRTECLSLYIWACCFVLFPQQQGVLGPCHLHTWFSLEHFKPSLQHAHTHTHTHIHRHPPLPFLFLSLSLSLSVSPSLSLTFFLPLFTVQLVNPSSLYRTTSFDTHSKSLSVSSCTDRMRPSFPKSCVGVREYMQHRAV